MIMERNEAIEVIKKNYPHVAESGSQFETALRILIPELAESEDERIRKALKEYFINSFQNNGVAAICGVHIKDILAWLEKQGEQMPTDVRTTGYWHVEDVEQKSAWSEEDKVKDNWELIHEFVNKFGRIPKDEDELNVLIEYVLKRQKPTEWSEEDERMFNSALWHVKNSCGNGGKNSGEFEVYSWLKSLKPQNRWKPSDEQMTQLHKYCPDNRPLTSLYEQLKKLKY